MQEVITEAEKRTPFELAAEDYATKLRRTERGRYANRMIIYASEGPEADERQQAYATLVSTLVQDLRTAPQSERGEILDSACSKLYFSIGTGEEWPARKLVRAVALKALEGKE